MKGHKKRVDPFVLSHGNRSGRPSKHFRCAPFNQDHWLLGADAGLLCLFSAPNTLLMSRMGRKKSATFPRPFIH